MNEAPVLTAILNWSCFSLQQTTAEVPANSAPRVQTPAQAAPPAVAAQPVQAGPSQAGPSPNFSHSDLVRSLEMTGMASVAAARAVQAATTNVIVDRSKQVTTSVVNV